MSIPTALAHHRHLIFFLLWLTIPEVTARVLPNIVILYADDKGIWIFRGIFPWTKGVSGVLWRDVDECTFINSFESWLFKSHTIVVRHRYTKSIELTMTHTQNGMNVCGEINSLHQKFLGMSSDDQSLSADGGE